MPIMVQNNDLVNDLRIENMEEDVVFVMDEKRARHQDIRPLEIAVLNLSPSNEDLELAVWRSLSNTPLQLNITSMVFEKEEGYRYEGRLKNFTKQFSSVRRRFLDGLVVTGISGGSDRFEDARYRDELCELLEWSDSHVTSTLFLGEGAQMALNHFYGIDRVKLSSGLFGVYSHRTMDRGVPLVRGFDDEFCSPHVRATGLNEELLRKEEELRVLAESDEAGSYLFINPYGSRIFCLGHPELSRSFLDREYRRRIAEGIRAEVPKNYYPDDDAKKTPLLQWRGHGNSLFSNWLNYYVYQNTPFEFNQIFLEDMYNFVETPKNN